jgi:mono/diheme cytochrome c family protein
VPLRRPLSGVALALTATVLAAGCGTGGKASPHADQQNGATLFTAKCAGCHVLAAAGSQGTTGPNLDDAFGPSRKQGFKQSTIQNVVLDQNVAAYVAAVAGQGGTSTKPPSQVGTDGKAIFQANCASCHTLKAANASGTIGPNLDQLKPPLARVKHQVEVGGGVMPAFKGRLTPAQIDAVAKFVSSSAGK